MAILHRIPIAQGDVPQKAGNLTKCQWCHKPLNSDDTVWECMGNIGHYLACDDCHETAIIH